MKRSHLSTTVVLAVLFPLAALLYSATFYLVGPANLIYGLLVIVIGIAAVSWSLAQTIRRRNRLPALCFLAGVVVWFIWILLPTRQLGIHTRFWIERSIYDEAVAQLRTGQVVDCLREGTCKIDAGPPRRLAFSWGGIIDNWIGIVFDPAHEVANPDRHRGLFGGDLIYCQLLTADYYICSFT